MERFSTPKNYDRTSGKNKSMDIEFDPLLISWNKQEEKSSKKI